MNGARALARRVQRARARMVYEVPRRAVHRDSVVWIGLASCAGALTTASAAPALVVAGAVALLLVRTGRPRARWLVVAAAALFFLGAKRSAHEIDRHERARTAVLRAGPWPVRCIVDARVARSPVMMGDGLRVEVDAADVRCRDGPPLADARVALHVPVDETTPRLARGDRGTAIASLAPPYRFWNDGLGDPRPLSARRGVVLSGGAEDVLVTRAGAGVASVIDRARAHLRARIIGSFPHETAPMARALLLDLPDADQRAFRRSGLVEAVKEAPKVAERVKEDLTILREIRALKKKAPKHEATLDAAAEE